MPEAPKYGYDRFEMSAIRLISVALCSMRLLSERFGGKSGVQRIYPSVSVF